LFFAAAIFAASTFAVVDPAAADDQDWKAVVESLASKNKPPVIAGPAIYPPPDPTVSTDYDWSEQDRAWKVARELAANAEAAWPVLVEHFDDRRYVLTVKYTVSGVVYQNWTVGDICRQIVLSNIKVAFSSEIEWGTKAFAHHMSVDGFTGGVELKRWCEERRGKPLFELQAEACRWAAGELTAGEARRYTSAEAANRSVAQITAREKKLLDSKTAVRTNPIGGDLLALYRKPSESKASDDAPRRVPRPKEGK
jgi:hypothetical protein